MAVGYHGEVVIVEQELTNLASPFVVSAKRSGDIGWMHDIQSLEPFLHETIDLGGSYVTAKRRQIGEGPRVIVTGTCPSCLDTAWGLADIDVLNDFDSVMTYTQTQGRGQLRRQWSSPAGNVYAALVLPERFGPLADAVSVALGAGVVLCFQSQGIDARLKWPNDILVGDKKVGGILIEERHGQMIAGIGINLASCPPASALRRDAAIEADCLRFPGVQPGPLTVWLHLVEFLQKWYVNYLAVASSCRFVSDIERNLAWLGHSVLITNDGPRTYKAEIIGLADDGGLLIETYADGNVLRRVLHGGSIIPLM
ncbi:biotin--[acetyl-CoA-carboxylase] ligase [Desulfovibrio inopinatus]|uniref:biotin--[acetyl-CoA-carboxylase] ligase n=1 Tax=Desulfovibrio inopinatus TaxID=102109 RepID=UPI00041E78E3|nr:biotin--[acetyl-CoA-carboxylase] ligase [Desulfovibrio inopinatus]